MGYPGPRSGAANLSVRQPSKPARGCQRRARVVSVTAKQRAALVVAAGRGSCQAFVLFVLLRTTAWRISALKADSSTSSPSWMSIARRTFPSRLELKRRAGSLSDAPLANVSFTTLLYDSPVQMMPSWDQTGVPGLLG